MQKLYRREQPGPLHFSPQAATSDAAKLSIVTSRKTFSPAELEARFASHDAVVGIVGLESRDHGDIVVERERALVFATQAARPAGEVIIGRWDRL